MLLQRVTVVNFIKKAEMPMILLNILVYPTLVRHGNIFFRSDFILLPIARPSPFTDRPTPKKGKRLGANAIRFYNQASFGTLTAPGGEGSTGPPQGNSKNNSLAVQNNYNSHRNPGIPCIPGLTIENETHTPFFLSLLAVRTRSFPIPIGRTG